MNRRRTVETVAEATEFPRKEVEEILESFIDCIVEELGMKGRTFIRGLGSLKVKYVPPMERRDMYRKRRFMDREKFHGKFVPSKDVQAYLLSRRRGRTKASTE